MGTSKGGASAVPDGAHTALDIRDGLIFGRTVEQNILLGQTRTEGLKFVIHIGRGEGGPLESVNLLNLVESYL